MKELNQKPVQYGSTEVVRCPECGSVNTIRVAASTKKDESIANSARICKDCDARFIPDKSPQRTDE